MGLTAAPPADFSPDCPARPRPDLVGHPAFKVSRNGAGKPDSRSKSDNIVANLQRAYNDRNARLSAEYDAKARKAWQMHLDGMDLIDAAREVGMLPATIRKRVGAMGLIEVELV